MYNFITSGFTGEKRNRAIGCCGGSTRAESAGTIERLGFGGEREERRVDAVQLKRAPHARSTESDKAASLARSHAAALTKR